MPELVIGAIIGVIGAAQLGIGGVGAAVTAVVVAVVVYLAGCWAKPYRGCWWPWHEARVRDKRGNYRLRTCRLCGGMPWRRLGARLIGRGKT